MNVVVNTSHRLAAAAILAASMIATAQAQADVGGSQAERSALGTGVQNMKLGAYPADGFLSFPGGPSTEGAPTFAESRQNIIGGTSN